MNAGQTAWSRFRASKTTKALWLQLRPRLAIFGLWTLINVIQLIVLSVQIAADPDHIALNMHVFGMGKDGYLAMVVIGFALSLLMFRPLLSLGVTRHDIIVTHTASNLVFVMAAAVEVTLLYWLIPSTHDVLRHSVVMTPPMPEPLLFSSSASLFGPVDFGATVLGSDERVMTITGPSNLFAMFLTATMTWMICIAFGALAGEIWARLNRTWRICGSVAVVVGLTAFLATLYGSPWERGYRFVIDLARGRVLKYDSTATISVYGPGVRVAFNIWPQVVITVIACTACVAISFWLTRRRELPVTQRMPVLC